MGPGAARRTCAAWTGAQNLCCVDWRHGVVAFRGIPYAQPPVGALRFARPQSPNAWSGVRDATAFGPTAMQASSAISDGQSVVVAPTEDCLLLNVWTPALDGDHRPVLVWLHGGAFVTGAGSMSMSTAP